MPPAAKVTTYADSDSDSGPWNGRLWTKHAVLGLRKTIDPLENDVELILDGLGRTVEKREDLAAAAAAAGL